MLASSPINSVTVVSNSLLLGRYKSKFAIKKQERQKDIHSTKDLGETYVPPASAKA
jgi:hypothetical protein